MFRSALAPQPIQMTVLICIGLFLFSGRPHSQAASFRPALPGYQYHFPRDHASHPEYATEWWYYTGHLQAANGKRFGYELTFFRIGLMPNLAGRTSKWATRDIMLGHLALTDETGNQFYFVDRASRAALGLAGAETATPHVWINDWAVHFGGKNDVEQTMRAVGQSHGTQFGISLVQRPAKPLVIHGEKGISQKSAGVGRASHYYSFTRLATQGTVRVGNQRFTVTGQSWFDHEFGSNQLGENQAGWDWFSIQLDDGREIMLYHMRLRSGGTDPFSSGTFIERNGTARHLRLQDFRAEPLNTWHSPVSGANYPAHWRVTLPHEGIILDITPTVANQELATQHSTGVTYWEGSVRVLGTQRGHALQGVGYVELTGYAGAFNSTF